MLPEFVAGGPGLAGIWFAVAWTYAILAVPILLLPAALARRAGPALRAITEVLLRSRTIATSWNAGLVLFGVHVVLIGCLASRSGYVPQILGVLPVIAGAPDATGPATIDRLRRPRRWGRRQGPRRPS